MLSCFAVTDQKSENRSAEITIAGNTLENRILSLKAIQN